jgi:HEAT repeat protein
MRVAAVLMMVMLVGGCGRREPLLSHGRPVSYWLEKVHDRDARERKKAVVALGHVGAADSAAIPAVVGAVKDKDAVVRRQAVLALLNANVRDAVPALTEAQNDSDPQVRAYAAKALERIQGGE